MTLDPSIVQTLERVSTATLTTVLLKKGLRNVWMRGTRPLQPDQPRIVGRAFTMRFVPAREDLATPESWASPRSTRAAIEDMPADCVVVVDAMGITDAGIFGDILCLRMQKRRVAGLVTDGVVRDGAGVLGTGLPVWCQGVAAPPSVAGLTFVDWQEPIGCGGVAVFPDDVVVVDGDGAVIIPASILDEVVAEAAEQERLEEWIMGEVEGGVPLPGLYPANAETMARYQAAMSARQGQPTAAGERRHAIEADKAVGDARANCEGNRHAYGKKKRLTLTRVSDSGKVAYFTFAEPTPCVKCDFVAPKGTRWSETVRPGLVERFPAIAGK